MQRVCRGLAGVGLFVGSSVFSGLAQLPSPRLDTAFPQGAQAGAAVEVTLTGSDLGDVSALVFDTPGLAALKIDALKFRVSAAADCVLGFHEVRAATRLGISTALPFIVGAAPEMQESAKNHAREAADVLPVPGVIHGRAEAEQRDFYKVTAKAGDTIYLACSAFAIDSPMDPVVSVTDARGTTLARGDDELDRDAQLHFVAPADGDYFVVVQDKLFGGSAGARVSPRGHPRRQRGDLRAAADARERAGFHERSHRASSRGRAERYGGDSPTAHAPERRCRASLIATGFPLPAKRVSRFGWR